MHPRPRRRVDADLTAGDRLRSRRAARTVALVLALVVAPGCGSADGDDVGTTGDGGDGDVEAPRLSFDEIALELPADRRQDVNLRATSVVPGRTFAVLDGAGIIQAGNVTAAGVLEEGLLELRLDGALAEGEHRLELVTNADGAVLRSDPVILRVTGLPADELPHLELGEARGGVGPALHAFGRPTAGSTGLGILRADGNGGYELGIVVRGESRWLAGSPLVTAMPGFHPDDVDNDDDPRTQASDLVDFAPRTGAAEGLSYTSAWRPDPAGQRVLVAVTTTTGDLPPTTAFELDDVVAGPVAAGRVEGLRWVGDALAVAFRASVDAEHERPGDRAVAAIRLHDDATEVEGLLDAGGLSDLDQLGDVVYLADPDPTRARVGVRTHRGRARVIAHSSGAPVIGLRPDPAFDAQADFPDPDEDGGPRWLGRVAFLGALDSHTVVGVRSDGRVRLAQGSASTGERTRVDIDDDALAAAPVSGRPSGMVMDGLPIVVIPFGDAAPVQVLVTSGTQWTLAPLDDLRCDQVVLDASARAADEHVSDLACLANGEVTLHEVRLVPLP